MIGTDPEFFIKDGDGKPVPAWRHFQNKDNKGSVPKMENYKFFRDGYALELNVPPESCRERFGNSLYLTLAYVMTMLPKGYTLSTEAAVKIDLLDAMQDVPPDAQVFGCDPAYNAYDGQEHSVDLDAMEHEYRYAGGHLHLSGINPEGRKDAYAQKGKYFLASDEDKFMFIKLCDLFIGLPLAYLFDTQDEVARRQFYGKAGECRLQKYPKRGTNTVGDVGVEYRTPSPKVYNHYNLGSMFLGVMRTIGTQYEALSKAYNPRWEKPIQRAINTCQVEESMLQTCSGFYTPELLKDVKRKGLYHQFLMNSPQHTLMQTGSEKLGVVFPAPNWGYAWPEWVTREYGGPPQHVAPSHYTNGGLHYVPARYEDNPKSTAGQMLGYVRIKDNALFPAAKWEVTSPIRVKKIIQ